MISKADGTTTTRTNAKLVAIDVVGPYVYWSDLGMGYEQTRLDGTGAHVALRLGSLRPSGLGANVNGVPVVTARGLYVFSYVGGFESGLDVDRCGGTLYRASPTGDEPLGNLPLGADIFATLHGLYYTTGGAIFRVD